MKCCSDYMHIHLCYQYDGLKGILVTNINIDMIRSHRHLIATHCCIANPKNIQVSTKHDSVLWQAIFLLKTTTTKTNIVIRLWFYYVYFGSISLRLLTGMDLLFIIEKLKTTQSEVTTHLPE